MKQLTLFTALACSLAIPARAGETTDFASPSQLKLAADYIQQELDARFNPPGKQPVRLDQPGPAKPSAAQQEALRQIFGQATPLDIQRLPGKGAAANYSLHIPGYEHAEDGVKLQWQAISGRINVDANGKRYSANASWPGLQLQLKDVAAQVQEVSYSAQESRDASGLWIGKGRADAQRISLHTDAAPLDLAFEHASFQTDSKRQGKQLEQSIDMAAQRMTVAGTAIDELHIGYRIHHLDIGTLANFRDSTRKLRKADLPAKEMAAASLEQALTMFKELALKGGILELSDLSGSFEGARFQVKGSIATPGATAADLATSDGVLNKLEAHLDITLPTPMLHSIARTIVRVTKEKQPGELREQDVYDVLLGKLIGPGYARMENGKLVAHLHIKQGMLRITDSQELIPLQSLLKTLKPKNTPTPPEDHSVPVPVTWRDRSLENVRLFAGNGSQPAIDELCYRYTQGDHAPKDSGEAEHWCERSKGAPDLSDADHGSDDPRVFSFSEKPGYYSTHVLRFDESKTRVLELSLSNPGQHEKWMPMVSVCLSAEAPSDLACIKLSPPQRNVTELSAKAVLLSTDAQSEKDIAGQTATEIAPQDIQLRVFIREQKAHFVINGKDDLVQDVVFPVELIHLICSTADCRAKLP